MMQSEMDKNLDSHSPHKNKVLKHSFFGSIFGNIQKSKLVECTRQNKADDANFSKDDEEYHKTKDDLEDNINFTQIQNSKFPIVSVKPLSRQDVENYKGEVRLNEIGRKHESKTASIFSCSSDSESEHDIVEIQEPKPPDAGESIVMQEDEHVKQSSRRARGSKIYTSSSESEDGLHEGIKPPEISTKSSDIEDAKNCNVDLNWKSHTNDKEEFYTVASSSNSEDEIELPDIYTSSSSLTEFMNKTKVDSSEIWKKSVGITEEEKEEFGLYSSDTETEDLASCSAVPSVTVSTNKFQSARSVIDEVRSSRIRGKTWKDEETKNLSSSDLEIQYLSSDNKNASPMNVSSSHLSEKDLNRPDEEDELESKTSERNVDIYNVSSDSDIEVISSRGSSSRPRGCIRRAASCKMRDRSARKSSSLKAELKKYPDLTPSVSVTFKTMKKSWNCPEVRQRNIGMGIMESPNSFTKMLDDDDLKGYDTTLNPQTGNGLCKDVNKEDEVDVQQYANADSVESGLSIVTHFNEGKSLITESTRSVYKCSRCSYISRIRGHAKSHSLIHATFKLFRCSECTFGSNRKDKLRLHVMKTHKLDSSCYSRYCFATTKNIDVAKEISYHNSITEESVRIYQCSVCAFVAEQKADVESHVAVHTEMDVGVYKSNECPSDTPKRIEKLREQGSPFDHLYNTIESFEITKAGFQATEKHLSIFECSVCSYQTIKRDRAKRHALTHSETKLFRCPECAYDTDRSENVKIHWNSVHGKESIVDVEEENENKVNDSIQTRSLDSVMNDSIQTRSLGSVLNDSIQTRSLDSVLNDSIQTRSLGSVLNDSIQTRSLDSQTFRESFKCCLCSYQTSVRTEAEDHLMAHLNSRGNSNNRREAAMSDTCRSRRSRNLETKRMEIVERCYKTINEIMITDSRTESITDWKSMYVCSVCNYQTKSKAVARRHSLNHSETKIFNCDLCQYTTNRKDMLKSHEKRHKSLGKCLPIRGRKKLIQPIHSREKSEYIDDSQTMENIGKERNLQNQLDNYNTDTLQTNYDFGVNDACTETPLTESQSEFKALIDDSFLEIKDPLDESTELPILLAQASQIISPKEDSYSYAQESYSYSQYGPEEDPKDSMMESDARETSSNVEGNFRSGEKVYSLAELLKCAEYDYLSYKESEEFDPPELDLPEDEDAYFNPENRKLLRCIECVYKTYERNDMRTHLGTHINSSLLECPECNFETTSESILIKHKKTCDATYESDKSKRRRKQGFHCPECDYQSKYKKVLDKHLRTHTDGGGRGGKLTKFFYCTECDYKNITKANVKRHAKEHEKKIFRCSGCDYATYYRFAMMNHARPCKKSPQRDVDEYKQTVEQNVYEQGDSFPEFDTDINNNITDVSDNAYNGTNISDNINYDQNVFNDSGFVTPSIKVLKCAQCNFQTYLRSRLKKHLQVHSTDSEEVIDLSGCICDMCLNNVNDYTSSHPSSQEVFKCSKCNFATHLQDYLKTHEQIHDSSDWDDVFQEVGYACQ